MVRPLTELPKRLDQLLDVGQLADAVNLGEGDSSILIDDEGGALADAGYGRAFAENAEFARDFGVGIEVGAEGNLHGANFFLAPRGVAGDRVYADVQNLGIERLELFAAGIEFGYLAGSSRGPVERVEGDDEIFDPEIVAGAHRSLAFAGNCGKSKIRRRVANFQGHIILQSEQNCN
jgi:hypothetical protein